MSITSDFLGPDFKLKPSYTYISRLLIDNEDSDSRIKVNFKENSPFPFTVYLRELSHDGTANMAAKIYEEFITQSIPHFTFTCHARHTYYCVFELPEAVLENSDIESLIPQYEIEIIGIKNEFLTDLYMFETEVGAPYQPYAIENYSEYEFTEKSTFTSQSDYVDKHAVSKLVASHDYHNERGSLNRMYITSKLGKTHGREYVENKTLADKEEFYVYIDTLESTKDIINSSNAAIKGLLLKTSDPFVNYGLITFHFITTETDSSQPGLLIDDRIVGPERKIRDDDIRKYVAVATRKAPESLVPDNTLPLFDGLTTYGLSNKYNDSTITLRLEDGELSKEATFYYYIVYANFLFRARGLDDYGQRLTLLNDIRVLNKTYYEYTPASENYILEAPDSSGEEILWYLLDRSPRTAFPKFVFKEQNFTMPEGTYQFIYLEYRPLKNIFAVYAIDQFSNRIKHIIDLSSPGLVCFWTIKPEDIPRYYKMICFEDKKIGIKAWREYELDEEAHLPVYDYTLDMPLWKFKAQIPNGTTQNIDIKYKYNNARFKILMRAEIPRSLVFPQGQKGFKVTESEIDNYLWKDLTCTSVDITLYTLPRILQDENGVAHKLKGYSIVDKDGNTKYVELDDFQIDHEIIHIEAQYDENGNFIENQVYTCTFWYKYISANIEVNLLNEDGGMIDIQQDYFYIHDGANEVTERMKDVPDDYIKKFNNYNLLQNYKLLSYYEIFDVTSGENHDNAWLVENVPIFLYKPLKRIYVDDFVYYERIEERDPELTDDGDYKYTPLIQGITVPVQFYYKRYEYLPAILFTFAGYGCSWQNGYRCVIVDLGVIQYKDENGKIDLREELSAPDPNKVLFSFTSQFGTFTYNRIAGINPTGLQIRNDFDENGFPALVFEILSTESVQNYCQAYRIYIWNSENGKGGSDPHPCNGFTMDTLNAYTSDTNTYPNSKYKYKANIELYNAITENVMSNGDITLADLKLNDLPTIFADKDCIAIDILTKGKSLYDFFRVYAREDEDE